MSEGAGAAAEGRPLLRVVRGDASPEEIAALMAVLGARSAAVRPAPRRARRPVWADPGRAVREPLRLGPGAWRASAWPR